MIEAFNLKNIFSYISYRSPADIGAISLYKATSYPTPLDSVTSELINDPISSERSISSSTMSSMTSVPAILSTSVLKTTSSPSSVYPTTHSPNLRPTYGPTFPTPRPSALLYDIYRGKRHTTATTPPPMCPRVTCSGCRGCVEYYLQSILMSKPGLPEASEWKKVLLEII